MHDCDEVGGMSPDPLSEHYNHVRLYNTNIDLGAHTVQGCSVPM